MLQWMIDYLTLIDMVASFFLLQHDRERFQHNLLQNHQQQPLMS